MKRVNLIPGYRLEARQRRRLTRRWAIAAACYSAAMLASCVAAHALWGGEDDTVAENLVQVTDQIKSTDRLIARLQPRLAEASMTLRANRELRDRPDWSALLSLLAGTLDDDVVLRECHLEPMARQASGVGSSAGKQGASKQGAGPAHAFRLAIRGMGRTQPAVSRYVLRLEQSGVFDRVQLIDTGLEPYLSDKAVAFRLECTLSEPAGAKP